MSAHVSENNTRIVFTVDKELKSKAEAKSEILSAKEPVVCSDSDTGSGSEFKNDKSYTISDFRSRKRELEEKDKQQV